MKTKIYAILISAVSLVLGIYCAQLSHTLAETNAANPIGQINVLNKQYTVLDTSTGKPAFTLPKGAILQDVTPSNMKDKMQFVLRISAPVPRPSPMIPADGWFDRYSFLIPEEDQKPLTSTSSQPR